MSQSAEITLTGNSRTLLLMQLDIIRKWDNGHDYDIKVFANGSKSYVFDKIANVEKAIKEDLENYLKRKFNLKGMEIRVGTNDDLWLYPVNNSQKKIKTKVLQLLPKKKRKKNKKTHRK